MTTHHLLRITLDEVRALRMQCNRCGCAVELKVAGDNLTYPPEQCPGCRQILHDHDDEHPLLGAVRGLRQLHEQARAEKKVTFFLEVQVE